MSRSEDRDREAVERILGRTLDGIWPADAHPAGTRVTVIHDAAWAGPWLNEFSATIDPMGVPEPVKHPHAMPAELKYWVVFDEPQYDAQGDGPYRKAQIWRVGTSYLSVLRASCRTCGR